MGGLCGFRKEGPTWASWEVRLASLSDMVPAQKSSPACQLSDPTAFPSGGSLDSARNVMGLFVCFVCLLNCIYISKNVGIKKEIYKDSSKSSQ